MTIKQLGGVFGRNPTFNDVTIEGELTFDGDIDINSDLKIDGNLEVTGTSTLNDLTTITKSSGEQLSLVGWSWTNGANGSSGALELGPNAAYQAQIGYAADGNTTLSFDNTYSSDNAKTQFRMKTSGSAVVPLTIYGSGNVELSNNLVMASGQGIDFSATAGAGTSELLDDYEEGEHTAVITATTSGTITLDSTNNKLAYTKVGRVVHVHGLIVVDSVSSPVGVAKITLPFTASSGLGGLADRSPPTIWIQSSVSKNTTDFIGYVVEGTNQISVGTGDSTNFTSLGANELQAASAIYISVTYTAS